jgi:DNA-binding transcriptional LysR family regulator
MSPDAWKFAVGKSTVSVAIHSRLIVNTAEAAIDAAIAGVGITRVLSYQVASALRAGTLALALREFEPKPLAGQSRLCRPGIVAAEAARLSRFRGAASESAACAE